MIIKDFDTDKKVLIIAEIGNNHEGDFELAKELIRLAAESGADAVKFQTFIPEYYSTVLDKDRQERLNKFKLSFEQFTELRKECERYSLIFISTPFDIRSARFLSTICHAIKISSSDNTFYPLITEVANTGKPLILSTGLADKIIIGKAVSLIKNVWMSEEKDPGLALLHCKTIYPTPPDQVNLAAIKVLAHKFSCCVGYSDHTIGIKIPVLSVVAGARIVEKHFTIDKNYSHFRDHQLSADPAEFSEMVKEIRFVEKVFGKPSIVVSPLEKDSIISFRRSIVPISDMPAGTIVTENNITWVRPGGGIPPGDEDRVLGRKLKRNIKAGEMIMLEDLMDA